MSDQPRASRRAQRQQRREAAQSKQNRRRLALIGGLVLIAVVSVSAFAFAGLPGGEDEDFPQVTVAEESPSSVTAEGRTMGDPDAPVTVVEWGNYK